MYVSTAPDATVVVVLVLLRAVQDLMGKVEEAILSGILLMCHVRIVMKRLFRFRLSPSPTSQSWILVT